MELKNQILKALGLSESVKLEYQNKLEDGRDRLIYQYIQYAKRKWP